MEITVENVSKIVRTTIEDLRRTTYRYKDLEYTITGSKTTNSVYIRLTTTLPTGEVLPHSIRVSDHPKNTDKEHKGKVVILHARTNPSKLKRSVINTVRDLYNTRASVVINGGLK